MFKELRNRLIAINLIITTIVLIGAFSSVYIVALQTTERRNSLSAEILQRYTPDIAYIMQEQIRSEQEAARRTLLFTLIVTGILMEGLVALLSYFLAEEAIKPIKKAYETQKIFIANASHEIKTPLAAIQANIEAADIQGNHWIDNVEIETEKLANLNNQLLNLARLDLKQQEVVKTEVKIDEAIKKNLDLFSSRIKKKGIKIVQKKTKVKNLKAKVCRDDFEQIFNILLDNAVKYCDKKIVIEIEATENRVRSVKIKNDGAKIQKSDIEHIFERFYQTDKTNEGVGLGLSIAKSLAERNEWSLLATVEKKMTVFLVKIG